MSKELFIQHLVKNGKDLSWEHLAKLFSLKNGETARGIWKRYRLGKTFADESICDDRQLITAKEIHQLQTNDAEIAAYIGVLESKVLSFQEDLSTGKAEMQVCTNQEIKSLEDLIEITKIDTTIWEITKYIQNFWNNKYQVKAFLSLKKKDENSFQQQFVEFLKGYTPACTNQAIVPSSLQVVEACLLINKQDSHLNKLDIDGNNNIDERFSGFESAVQRLLRKSTSCHKLELIVYVLGSDEFNSEWSGFTTKGTPQQNILSFHEAFEKICSHEIRVIDKLLSNSERVHISYVSGNHDEYVGWHLVNWLKAFYRNESRLVIDDTTKSRKYLKYGDSAVMFNHGDVIKPVKLAQIFPIEFREGWSGCENYYIFTGDKHHEKADEFGGIKFFQLPCLSNARSKWDERQGYTTGKAELIGFLIEKNIGLTDTYRQII